VVLLDEIEKAHPDVFNLLLQMLEEGRLTDSFGRKVDFKNTIIIMTSNIGAEMLKKQGSIGFKSQTEDVTYQGMKERLLDEVKKAFKPEFLNRVDDIIVFRSLTKEDLEHIVELEIKDVEARLKEQNIKIELTKEAKDFLIEKGFDKHFGARPLKRTIQRFLEDPMSEDIIKGTFKKGGKVHVTAKIDHLVFELV
jgi:ATP-dependent Clp protease ATP-binding subunit ClpC